MSGSLHIATIQKIPVLIHWSFSLLFVWLGYVGFSEGMDMTGVLWFFFFALLLFVCVVVHEFGHALTAREFGVETKDIILSPLGGLARLNRLPDKPIQEFLIAIAGPATNVVIAILIFPIVWFSPSMSFVIEDGADVIFTKPANLLPLLFYTNITLVIFNMIPAFPMDGGRVLRSLLAMYMDRLKATRVAVVIGQVFGLIFIIGAIFLGELILGLIGLFVFFMATAEYRSARLDSLLRAKTVSQVMRTQFTQLRLDQELGVISAVFMTRMETSFLVFDENGHVLKGILNAEEIVKAFQEGRSQTKVSELDIKKPAYTFLNASLTDVFYKMINNRLDIIPVLKEREIIGVVDQRAVNTALSNRQPA